MASTQKDMAGGTSSSASVDEGKLALSLELYKATTRGDWTSARRIFDDDPESLTAPLAPSGVTILHLAATAASSAKNILFLRQLLDLMGVKGLSFQAKNTNSRNALHYAARAGNAMAAELLVEKDPVLTQQLNNRNDSPLHEETVRYLIPVSRQQGPSLLTGKGGVGLLNSLINGQLFTDMADVTSSSASERGTSKPETSSMDEAKLAQSLELYKATTSGDWASARRIFDGDAESVTAPLSPSGVTVLHLAAAAANSPKNILFLQQLLDLMGQKGISFQAKNTNNRNALHYAAQAGNAMAAELLVEKDPVLTQQLNKANDSPLHVAASYGHEETVRYLMPASRRQDPSLFAGERGVGLLKSLIMDSFYDLAIELLEKNPELAIQTIGKKYTAIDMLTQKPQAFPSGRRLTLWERILHNLWENILAKKHNPLQGNDIENPITVPGLEKTGWKNFSPLGLFKKFHTQKLKDQQVLLLLKTLAEKAAKSDQANVILGSSARLAAESGIHEIVAEVIKAYPNVIFTNYADARNVFDIAVVYRQERVFSLLFQLSTWKHFSMGFDKRSNTMLHLAAKLEPFARIDKIPGAALQMQRELQWFKAVEQIVEPWYTVAQNHDHKVPEMLFFESHKELVKEGEAWMKDTANSYTIVSALVVTVAFAAAFTLPGGNNGDSGLPIFLNDAWFMVFSIANTFAMFSSATSLLMFLGILTSRYSQEDFRMALPMRLAIGQLTLFFAIATMLVAFAAATNIFLSHRVAWVIVPIGLLACVPLSLFVFLQFPLLVEVVYSTFGPTIFRKHSDETLM